MPKLSRQFISDRFTEVGYELLGDYVNNSTPIKFRCDKGHEHQITWNNLRDGHRCGVCFGNYVSPEDVGKAFANAGYQILGEYVNCETPIKFRCDKGHEHQIRWNSFQSGRRCGVCFGNYVSPEDVGKAFAKVGYQLLGEYVNNKTPIKFRCDKGHEHQMTWHAFQDGHRCGVCFTESHNSKHIKNQSQSRIAVSVTREIARQGLPGHWSDYHDRQTIKEIAEALDLAKVYKKCPKGHHIDHIIPTSKFNLLDEKQLRACWSPDNLRYLPATKNISRGNRMTLKEVEMMAKKHPQIALNASRLDFNVPIQIPIDLSYGFPDDISA